MGEIQLSNIKRPENLIKMLIVVLSLIGFALLLVALKCHNNNIHIESNLHFNRLVAASFFRTGNNGRSSATTTESDPVWPPSVPESVRQLQPAPDSDAMPAGMPSGQSGADAHHAFECALFRYKVKNSELFLLLVNFTYFFITCLTLITCLVSEGFTRNMVRLYVQICYLVGNVFEMLFFSTSSSSSSLNAWNGKGRHISHHRFLLLPLLYGLDSGGRNGNRQVIRYEEKHCCKCGKNEKKRNDDQ